ncbi:hypothetical protein B0H11DRAFT_2253847 [Mycena galericulata]|nr:hypothetical protein B0H11DRAFT_2253847 [Mycena galericulata]
MRCASASGTHPASPRCAASALVAADRANTPGPRCRSQAFHRITVLRVWCLPPQCRLPLAVACGRAARLPVPREATQRSMGEPPTAAKAPRVLPALLTRTDTIRRNYQAAPSDRGLGPLAATRCRCGRCGQCTYPGTA